MALVSDVDVSGGTEVIAEADTIFCIFRMNDNALRIYTVTTFSSDADKFCGWCCNSISAKANATIICLASLPPYGSLKNRKVTMTVRVSEATENVRAVSRVEKFQMMAQKNNALLQLKEEFGLELY